jgi:hypothetical protein
VIFEIDAPGEQAAQRKLELYVAAWQVRLPGMCATQAPHDL